MLYYNKLGRPPPPISYYMDSPEKVCYTYTYTYTLNVTGLPPSQMNLSQYRRLHIIVNFQGLTDNINFVIFFKTAFLRPPPMSKICFEYQRITFQCKNGSKFAYGRD